MRTTVRRASLGLALIAAVLTVALPAGAAAPTKETFIDEGLFALPNVNCHGFKLREVTDSELVEITTYTDKTGTPVKVVIKVNFFGTITNSKTGEAFRDHVSFTETHDLVAGTVTIAGSTFHFVESGDGVIFSEGGRKIIVEADGTVLFDAGPTDLGETGLAGLCEPLS